MYLQSRLFLLIFLSSVANLLGDNALFLLDTLQGHSVNVVNGQWYDACEDLETGGPFNQKLSRVFYDEPRQTNQVLGWQFNVPDFFDRDFCRKKLTPNPLYSPKTEHDESGRLKKISMVKNRDQSIANWIQFDYLEATQGPYCVAETSNHDKAVYQFEKSPEGTFLLKDVYLNDVPSCTYEYANHPGERKKLMTAKNYPLGRFIKLTYHESPSSFSSDPLRDFQVGKVKQLLTPNCDSTPIITSSFEYQPGKTSVTDAIGHKVIYHYSLLEEITHTEDYALDNSLYRSQKNYWKNGQVICKALLDQLGNLISCIQFEYDDKGCLIKETLAGNLSGACSQPIIIEEGKVVANGVETYSKTYVYDENNLLITEEEDNGRAEHYRYDLESKFLAEKTLFKHGQKVKDTLYTYTDEGELKKELTYEGSFCKILEVLNFNEQGLPEVIEDKILLATGEEKLLTKQIKTYSVKGLLLNEQTLAANGDSIAQKTFTYDTFDRLIQEEDFSGNSKLISYDVLGNVTYEYDENTHTEIFHQYDFLDRCIRTEKRELNKIPQITSFSYNLQGLIQTSTDSCGNEIHFFYDEWGRKIKTVMPEVFDERAQVINPTFETEYDIADRPICERDPKGFETTISYNVRGQPILKNYADGTFESFIYNLDGSLCKKVERNGTSTLTEWDLEDRLIKKSVWSGEDALINETLCFYDGPYLISEQNSLESVKEYTYDESGKVLTFCQGAKAIYFAYDDTGNLIEQEERWLDGHSTRTTFQEEVVQKWNSEGVLSLSFEQDKKKEELFSQEELVANDLGQQVFKKKTVDEKGHSQEVVFDALGREVRILLFNATGEKLGEKELRYDVAGNKACEIYHCSHRAPFVTEWHYGPENRLEKVVEGADTTSQRISQYGYDSFGQLKEIIKPDGVSLFYHYDSLGQVSALFSTDDSIKYAFEYDEKGHLIQADDQLSLSSLVRTYDERGLLIEEQLSHGLALKNSYDLQGRRICLTLPDNSTICYDYDPFFLRSLTRKEASGKSSYHQSYTQYDLQGQIQEIELIGNLGKTSWKRDENGSVLELVSPFHSIKKGENSLSVEDPLGSYETHFNFDGGAQLTAEEGAFNSSFAYDELGNRLSSTHQYSDLNQLTKDPSFVYSYDLNGNLIQKKNFDQCLDLNYDALNRLTKVILNGEVISSYVYDCFHRRIQKQTGVGVVRYLYDGIYEIGSVNEAEEVTELKVMGCNGPDDIAALEINQQAFSPLLDFQGSILGLVAVSNGLICESTRYSSFGEELKSEQSFKNPWRYAGKRRDEETGFSYFGRRYYDPEIGRWITTDPAGYIDGPNMYAYCKNNPVNCRDFFGLSAAPQDPLKNFFIKAAKKIANFFKTVFRKIKPLFTLDFYDRLANKGFLFFLGYFKKKRPFGSYGNGEANDKVRVTMINGMLTNDYWIQYSIKALSESHGGVNIHYVHRPPDNFLLDLARAIMVRMGYVSLQARILADIWRELIYDMGGTEGGGSIIHYAHSIGTSETLAALKLLNAEEQKMIKVYSFGSPQLTSKSAQITHFVSIRDGICLLDLKGYVKALMGKNPSVVFVGSCKGIPFVDHLFCSPTYNDIWTAMGKTFVQWFGSLV